VPEPVETHDPEGVDYGWVMQTTFVLTILVGAPLVALVAWAVGLSLPTWAARAEFAIRVGALVWFVVAVGVFLYARNRE
jgi:membrane protein YdbS with pleckstrin-like domain